VNEKILEISLWLKSLFCTMAGEIPISVNILKKAIITVAIATIPKSAGGNIRAKIAVTIKEINRLEYLATAVKNAPESNCCLIDCVILFSVSY